MSNKPKVAIQGIPGSFHHQVALNEFGSEAAILHKDSFEEVAQAVENSEASHGVIAIENSIAGAILPNYDLIDRHGLSISGEHYLPISHQLMALPGQKIEDIVEVQTHPMALLQCKVFLKKYPQIRQLAGIDTASVAQDISKKKTLGKAAIAGRIASEIYGLEILAKDIQTVKSNFTRFILLEKKAVIKQQQHQKASIKVTIENRSGGLAKMLTCMHEEGLDLSKIQSIPVIEKPWEYSFFIDAVFEEITLFEHCMKRIQSEFGEVKIFGTYKVGKK